MADFAATVERWANATQEVHQAIFREAAQRVVEEMLKPRSAGGNMPIDTGFLRASLTGSKSDMPTMRDTAVPQEGATYSQDGTVNLVIATATLGETLYFGFVAAYARRLNLGFTGTDSLGRSYSQQGYLFVELAAQRWQEIVSQVEAELVTRAGLN